ncbi:MAG TPA: PA0069 family radical SAM protein [Pirellulales bacterium]|jgi:DNA repair photolyase|nr:PA0069 family radical SAM protein [Pirellulales bacterium]
MNSEKRSPKARGSHINPANRFEAVHVEDDWEHFDGDAEFLADANRPPVEYLPDASQTIVSENDSPDVPFRYSVNPYRGCAHGCSYCYARPGHEYLGLNAGLDFETKILVKHDAPALLRAFLARPAWRPEPITFSGVTDCFQPAEREFRLTRGCLEVAWEARQPISIVTKNALVCRDLDILGPMAAARLVHVNISVTTLDAELGRVMEPRTSTPAARLRAIRALTAAGVPTRVMVAPVIPALTDSEMPSILAAAAEAGAQGAGFVVLRLPLTVKPVFLEWLERTHPDKRQRVENAIRSVRGGALNSPEFGQRMRGNGPLADQIKQVFRTFTRKHGLDGKLPEYDCQSFRPPTAAAGQLRLF